ncbi:hypothetical protein AA106555_0055 [Neokomagataea thailandica NBRC 106555]|uniref:Transposase n=1 Tax=Neokomagataea thailandica NBRC 106555 TaxID=1223520 RepID=A0ABQ0QM11_9PROT|nr:hypothetical protein AA106555_0055 [Neokomagataea thailandica NBRC 106555]
MMQGHQLAQPLCHNLRINLRRRDIRMAKQHLQSPQICPTREKVARERMPQNVRTDTLRVYVSFQSAGV